MRISHLAAMLGVSLLIACGAPAPEGGAPGGESMRLTLMTYQLQPTFNDFMTSLCASFEAAHPGTDVEWLDFPAEGYVDKLMLLFQGGDPPDVVNLTFDIGAQVVQQGILADIRPLLPAEVVASHLPRIVRSGCETNGMLYGLPWYLSPVVMLTNRALMQRAGLDPERPPATFEEQVAMSRQIHERVPDAWGYYESLTEAGHLRDLLFQQNVVLAERGPGGRLRAAFNTPRGVEVLALWTELFRTGVLPRESIQPTHVRAIELFKAGQTAFFVTGPQFLRNIEEDAPDVYAQCGVAAAPRTPCGITGVDMMMLGVTGHGETPEGQERERRAAELAAFITNAENQLAFCRLAVIFPSVSAALEDSHFSQSDGTLMSDARVMGARTLREAEIFREVLPESGRLNQAMSRAIERTCLENVSPETALADAAAEWDAIFAALPASPEE